MAPVLVHMSKNTAGKFTYSPIAINFLVELAKTMFALGTLVMYGCGRPGTPTYGNVTTFLRDADHNRLLAIPGALYAVNNYLKFVMQLFFKPTTAKMLSNLKIIVIAVLMKSMMNRRFSIFQWEALFLLVAGITVNQLSSCSSTPTFSTSDRDTINFFSILYTLGSITIPALASVYNEFALKKHMETSVLVQNFFLYFYGMCFNAAGLILAILAGTVSASTAFSGFTMVTTLLIINNALQGILSSFFYKFADTILKKYSSTIATIFTGLLSAALFGHQLTLNFLIGVSIVFISMHIFFSLGGVKQGNINAKSDNNNNNNKRHNSSSSSLEGGGSLAVSPSMDHIALLARQGDGGGGDGVEDRMYDVPRKGGVSVHPMLPR